MRDTCGGFGRWAAFGGTAALAYALVACGKAQLAHPQDHSAAGAENSGNGGIGAAGSDAAGQGGAPPDLSSRPSELRRLTAAEYNATVSDVLGTTTAADLELFTRQVNGFDNNAATNLVGDELYLRYLETAEALSAEVFGSELLRSRVVTCTKVDDTTCVGQIIAQAGLHLFRRPLLDAELAGYQKAYARARARNESHEGALQEVLTALLVSAQFLYRMEFVPAAAGTQPISPYELATRLSYLLWSSAPDDALLDAAAQSALESDEQLAANVTRLLDDPKARRFAERFGGQWLGAQVVPTIPIDPGQFPLWSAPVALAAGAEIDAYFEQFLHNDLDFRGFFDSRAHFVNSDLAPVYGLNVSGTELQRYDLNGVDRRGFLGLAGFLVLTSFPTRDGPSRRGQQILEHLLCSPLPPEPADMPRYLGEAPFVRSYLEQFATAPDCASCHAQTDSLGLALESYDGIGFFRTAYSNGAPIDVRSTLPASLAPASGPSVVGLAGLSAALAQSPAFTACTARMLYTYGFGRTVSDDENSNVQALAAQWLSGPPTLQRLILRLVLSPTFRSRSDGGSL